ncbi:MAG: hypothetical protein M1142_02325 [Patescibacteria group bacterium]|nr:hypothetical protein [Patescibacteria group bacterium]
MDKQGFKNILNEALTPLNDTIKDLKEDVRVLKSSVLNIEQTVTSYADSYKENQRNIERLDTRLNVVEEELAIEPLENLKVPHFSE